MKHWFLGFLLLASCSPFEKGNDSTTSEATTTPTKNATTSTSNNSPASATSASTSTTAATTTATTATTATTTTEPALWPVANQKVNIPVCWDASISAADIRVRVQTMVQAQWTVMSALNFTGWDDCADGDGSKVRIRAASGASSASGLGFATGAEVRLNLNGAPDPDAIWSDALHELGHIAGLGHEGFSADDDDERQSCAGIIADRGITNDLPVVPPADRDVLDPKRSIMSQCHELDLGIAQSDNDAIAKLYNVPAVDWSLIETDDN